MSDLTTTSPESWRVLARRANDAWDALVAIVRALGLHRTHEWAEVVSSYRVSECLLPPSKALAALRKLTRESSIDFAAFEFVRAVHALREHPRTQSSGARRFAQHRANRRTAP